MSFRNTSLVSLPDEVLAHILGFLSLEERMCNVACVNRRFHGLCFTPELLEQLDVVITGAEWALPRASALLHFLMSHGRHIRHLNLKMEVMMVAEGLVPAEMAALAASCLSLLAGAAQLESLTVQPVTPLATTAWLPALTRLQRLQLGCPILRLLLPPGLSKLTALESASLTGYSIHGLVPGGDNAAAATATCLPTSLTCLYLHDESCSGNPLPHQLSLLQNLQSLTLGCARYTAASMGVLSTLGRLRGLVLANTEGLPPCLPALTQLEVLQLDGLLSLDLQEPLVAALPHMHELTALMLCGSRLHAVPPAVAQLPKLQRCCLRLAPARGPVIPRLPDGGAWLASLAWLALPWAAALHSVDVLAAAHRLEYLCITDAHLLRLPADESWDSFWWLVATHPPLRCLTLDSELGDMANLSVLIFDALLELKDHRPELCVRRLPRGPNDGVIALWWEMVELEDVPA